MRDARFISPAQDDRNVRARRIVTDSIDIIDSANMRGQLRVGTIAPISATATRATIRGIYTGSIEIVAGAASSLAGNTSLFTDHMLMGVQYGDIVLGMFENPTTSVIFEGVFVKGDNIITLRWRNTHDATAAAVPYGIFRFIWLDLT